MAIQVQSKFCWRAVLFFVVPLTLCSSQDTHCRGFKNLTAVQSDTMLRNELLTNSHYENNQDCYWQINAPYGKRVSIQISIYSMADINDGLAVLDGVNGSAIIASDISVSRRFRPGSNFVSSSNVMTLQFHSDDSGTLNGFILYYKNVESPTNFSCTNFSSSRIVRNSYFLESHMEYAPNKFEIPYPPNMSCSWTMPKVAGYYIGIRIFVQLGGGDCLRLSGDSMAGSSLISQSNVTYCGQPEFGYQESFAVTGDLKIEFSSDNIFENRGFRLSIQYLYSCPSTSVYSQNFGEVSCHAGVLQSQYYENNLHCSWRISVSPGKQIAAWLSSVSMHPSNDSITVIGGTTEQLLAGQGASLSGYRFVVLLSASNYMQVNFSTDSAGVDRGFSLVYSTRDAFCQGFNNLTVSSGEIASHSYTSNYNSYYLNDMHCEWQLNAPTGYYIEARFPVLFFSTLPFEKDAITLYDGPIDSAKIVTINRSNEYNYYYFQTYQIKSTSNIMSLRFTTDSIGTYFGFRLQYSTATLPSAPSSKTSAPVIPPTSAATAQTTTAGTTAALSSQSAGTVRASSLQQAFTTYASSSSTLPSKEDASHALTIVLATVIPIIMIALLMTAVALCVAKHRNTLPAPVNSNDREQVLQPEDLQMHDFQGNPDSNHTNAPENCLARGVLQTERPPTHLEQESLDLLQNNAHLTTSKRERDIHSSLASIASPAGSIWSSNHSLSD